METLTIYELFLHLSRLLDNPDNRYKLVVVCDADTNWDMGFKEKDIQFNNDKLTIYTDFQNSEH